MSIFRLTTALDNSRSSSEYWNQRYNQRWGDPFHGMSNCLDELTDEVVESQIQELNRHLHNNSIVLEVGCGYGRLASQVGSRCLSYTGIDFSQRAIKEAKTKNPDLNFAVADIFEWDETGYDLIFMVGVWSSVEERSSELVVKLRSLLFRGGKILIFEDKAWMTVFP